MWTLPNLYAYNKKDIEIGVNLGLRQTDVVNFLSLRIISKSRKEVLFSFSF